MSTSLYSAVTYSTGLGEREAEREREDISCIISCSSTRCLSDLVHDMPPCFSVSSSLALLYLIPSLHPPVSLTDAHFICLPVFPSQLYLFPCMFIRIFSHRAPTACSWQQRRRTASFPRFLKSSSLTKVSLLLIPHRALGIYSIT